MRIVRGDDAIMHPLSISPRANNFCPAQVRQVTRDFGLGEVQSLNEEANADFVLVHQAKESQPCTISERPEQKFHLIRVGLRSAHTVHRNTF